MLINRQSLQMDPRRSASFVANNTLMVDGVDHQLAYGQNKPCNQLNQIYLNQERPVAGLTAYNVQDDYRNDVVAFGPSSLLDTSSDSSQRTGEMLLSPNGLNPSRAGAKMCFPEEDAYCN